MMKLDDEVWHAQRPDAQAFDEVRVVTVPRYKTSGLSGDEWRIHAEIELWRKGVKIHSQGFRDVETACGHLYAVYSTACDDGKAYFAGDGKVCDQEGCAAIATVHYQLLQQFCRDGHPTTPTRVTLRHFCDRHKTRGDCGLDDADRNYVDYVVHS